METADMLIIAEKVAVDAARKAGNIVRALFSEGFSQEEKDDFGDILTEADLLAEKAILLLLHEAFPNHKVRSEESGWSGIDSDWLWLVDPLDGTNNFAIGLPLFGVSITLIHRQLPVMGVIYDTMLDKIYVAIHNQGATCDGLVMRMLSRPIPKRLTVGWIQGHKVQQDVEAVRLRRYVESRTKRMLRLWAPTLQWSMLARNQIDGVILYNSEGDDLYSGLLLVQEAGGLIMDYEGNPFYGMNPEPYLIACHPDRKDTLLQLVRDGHA